MKKLFLVFLAITVGCLLAGCSKAQPKKTINKKTDTPSLNSVEYEVVRKNQPLLDENGEILIEQFFDLVVIKGDGDNIHTINTSLEEIMNNFLHNEEELKTFINEPYIDAPYTSSCTTFVTHNDDGYISIKFTTTWYMGGVMNVDAVGYTYNLANGKPATLTELSGKDADTLESELKDIVWQVLTETYHNELYDIAHITLSEMPLSEFNFCIEDRQIVLLFPTGTFGPNALSIKTNIYLA